MPADRWRRDLAGGPGGLPEPVRTAAELAELRAIGEEIELPATSERTWDLDPTGGRKTSPTRRIGRPRLGHRRPRVARHDPPTGVRVRVQAWTRDTVAVALVVAATGDPLPGTRRVFPADDQGLLDAATWRGQLEFACEAWDAGADADDPGTSQAGADLSGSDAVAMARLLDPTRRD